MANILVISSGRPHGNTSQLVDSFAKGARDAGHQAEIISLLQTKLEPCLGCNICKQGKPCIQKDDFTNLVPKIHQADLLVLASPLYYWTISARTKAFLERLYSISVPDPAPPLGRYEKYPRKDCALLMTAADNLFWTFNQATAYYQFAVVNYLGFRDRGMLLAGGCGDSSGKPAIAQTGWLEKAVVFGKTIIESEDVL